MVAHNEYPIQVKYDSGHYLLADILGYALNMNKFKALFSNNNSCVKIFSLVVIFDIYPIQTKIDRGHCLQCYDHA